MNKLSFALLFTLCLLTGKTIAEPNTGSTLFYQAYDPEYKMLVSIYKKACQNKKIKQAFADRLGEKAAEYTQSGDYTLDNKGKTELCWAFGSNGQIYVIDEKGAIGTIPAEAFHQVEQKEI